MVNLQALGKYVDKNLASHLSNWPTDLLDRQVWRSIMIHVKADVRMQTNNYYTFKACFPAQDVTKVNMQDTIDRRVSCSCNLES